jgi:hypothetical protein
MEMRITSKLLLTAVMAIAAMAFGASSASAVEPVEIAIEGGGHISDGTEIHAVGQTPTTLIAHIPGVGEVVASQCQDEFHGTIDEDGSGELDQFEIALPGTCVRQACETGGVQEHWPFQIEEDHTTGLEMVHITFCLEATGGGEHDTCELELPIEHDPEEQHHYTIVSDGADCASHTPGVSIEVHGAWELEGRGLEIVHPTA